MINCSEKLYKKGSYWFRKLINLYSKDKNIIFEEHKKYPFVTAYYKDAMYKHYLYNFPINLSPVNTYQNYFKERLNDESEYDELRNKIDEINNKKIMVYGYFGIIHKMNKRLWNLRNNVEYRNASLLKAKNKTIYIL